MITSILFSVFHDNVTEVVPNKEYREQPFNQHFLLFPRSRHFSMFWSYQNPFRNWIVDSVSFNSSGHSLNLIIKLPDNFPNQKEHTE